MTEDIHAHLDPVFSKYRKLNDLQHSRLENSLSSGEGLLSPGEAPIEYETAIAFDVSNSYDAAVNRSLQVQTTWYQTSLEYLGAMQNVLQEMSSLSIQASSGASSESDRIIRDSEFQSLKKEISQIVDGFGGEQQPDGQFNTRSLFLGQSPSIIPSANSGMDFGEFESLNLYTGFGREGFSEMPLKVTDAMTQDQLTPKISGFVQGVSGAQVTLDENASGVENAYNGLSFEITSGTGAGQSSKILSYEAYTSQVTLQAPLAPPPDATSVYSIKDDTANSSLTGNVAVTSVRFAENVWGADNNRFNRFEEDYSYFHPLTDEEINYRIANIIPDTDLEPKTFAEKERRRELNIFDPVHGSIATAEKAEKMTLQIQNAQKQISQFMTRQQSKISHLQKQHSLTEDVVTLKEIAIQDLRNLDPAKAIDLYNNEVQESEKLLKMMQFKETMTQRAYGLIQNDPSNHGGSR